MNTHPAEQLYWRCLNWLRVREWRRGSASMVMAPCYAFRRELIDQIPEDVISDDVHVAWRVASSGRAVGIAGPVVHEVRGATTVFALFRQKVRRGSGIVREVFRFLPHLRAMRAPFNTGFLLRSGLVLLGPPLAGSAIALLFLAGRWFHENATSPTPLMSLGLLLTAVSLDPRVRRPVTLGAIVPLSAAVALLMYPVVRSFRDHRAAPSMKRGRRRDAYSP
jgi:hypothetical protein